MSTLTFNRLDKPRMLEELATALQDCHTFHISVSEIQVFAAESSPRLDFPAQIQKLSGLGRLCRVNHLGCTRVSVVRR